MTQEKVLTANAIDLLHPKCMIGNKAARTLEAHIRCGEAYLYCRETILENREQIVAFLKELPTKLDNIEAARQKNDGTIWSNGSSKAHEKLLLLGVVVGCVKWLPDNSFVIDTTKEQPFS